MDEKERKDVFLERFKELEQKLLSLCKSTGDEHVSFSRALNRVYYEGKDPIVSVWDNYDFLRTASDLRNILSHENNVCAPTESFLSRFTSLAGSIIKPLKARDIRTRNRIVCSRQEKVSSLLPVRNKERISHVPILGENGVVLGIFSRSTLFDYLSLKKDVDSSFLEKKRREREEIVSPYGHLNERFVFVSPYARADERNSLIRKTKSHDKPVGLILVTKNGNRKDKLLGLITLTDLAKIRK